MTVSIQQYFPVLFIDYNYSAQNAEVYTMFQAVSASFWALPWLGLPWVCTSPSPLGYFNLFTCYQCLNNKFWYHWKDFHEITNILFIFKERKPESKSGKEFLWNLRVIINRFQGSFLHFNFNIRLRTVSNFPDQEVFFGLYFNTCSFTKDFSFDGTPGNKLIHKCLQIPQDLTEEYFFI